MTSDQEPEKTSVENPILDAQNERETVSKPVLPSGTGPKLETLPGRIVVVERIYHSVPGRNPTSIDRGFGRQLVSREKPYEREMTLSQEWRAIEIGWIDKVGTVVVVLQATPEVEVGVAYEHVVDRRDSTDYLKGIQRFSRILSNELLRISPGEGDFLFLRSTAEESIVTVFVYPV